MGNHEFDEVVQEAVDQELNPVRFGTPQRVILYSILAASIVSSLASLATLLILAV